MNNCVAHKGGNYIVYHFNETTPGNKILDEGIHTGLETEGICNEVTFEFDNTLHMIRFKNVGGIFMKDIHKWNDKDNSWSKVFDLQGDINRKFAYPEGQTKLIYSGSTTEGMLYLVGELAETITIFSINMIDGTVVKETEMLDEENQRRFMTTHAVYHNGLVDVFGGRQGCGFMPIHGESLRFNLTTKSHKFVEFECDSEEHLGMSAISFVKYLPKHDAIIEGRSWRTCGRSRPMYDSNVWLLEKLTSDKPVWRRLTNKIPNGKDATENEIFFVTCDANEEVLLYGCKKKGIYVDKISFAKEVVPTHTLVPAFSMTDGDVQAFLMHGKLYLFTTTFYDQPTYNWGHRVLHNGSSLVVFDLENDQFDIKNIQKIPSLNCPEDCEEHLFVFNDQLHMITYSHHGAIKFKELYVFDFEKLEWYSKAKINDFLSLNGNDVTNKFDLIMANSTEDGFAYFAVIVDSSANLISLDITTGQIKIAISQILPEGPCPKLVSAVVANGNVDILSGTIGCGFLFQNAAVLRFNLKGKTLEMKAINADQAPCVGSSGPKHRQYIANQNCWLQMTGYNRKEMHSMVHDGSLYAIYQAGTESPVWKKFDNVITYTQAYQSDFVIYDSDRNRIIFGHPTIGLFFQYLKPKI
uniref:Ion_trans domain-containing protein n=1 Tax=Rhabditophanes sp. KR3021 TaxID=114890 RepID=A0AC35U3X5_9BILA